MQRGDIILARSVKHHFNATKPEWMQYNHPDKEGFFVFLLLGDCHSGDTKIAADQMLIDLGWTPPKKENMYEG